MVIAALVLARPSAADAAVSFKAENGWELSFDGFVNAFAVDEIGSEPPAGLSDPLLLSTDENGFRVRTGLLPGLFAFNVAAPPVDGLNMKARVGFYPQVNNANTRNDFEPQIDLREIFFTVDGGFGQVLVGKAINLYQGKNILTDMTLFGVGTQGGVSGNGTTLGRIGYGYLYSQFGAQFRYTTPSLSGLKLAAAVVDPSRLGGAVGGVPPAPVFASETRYPGFEGELSYAGDYGATKVQAWVSGLQQKAWFPATVAVRAGDDVTALGWAAGLGVSFGGLDLLASGFGGQALGSVLQLDVDALDATGEERDSMGFLAQAAFTLGGKTKLGVSYGQNQVDQTDAESAVGVNGIETRSSWTGGIYHDINKNLKVVAEYTHAMTDWFDGQDQSTDVIALGGFFLW